jgi:hypothetical protein
MEGHVNRELHPATNKQFPLTLTSPAAAAATLLSTTPGALEMEGHVNRELHPATNNQFPLTLTSPTAAAAAAALLQQPVQVLLRWRAMSTGSLILQSSSS